LENDSFKSIEALPQFQTFCDFLQFEVEPELPPQISAHFHGLLRPPTATHGHPRPGSFTTDPTFLQNRPATIGSIIQIDCEYLADVRDDLFPGDIVDLDVIEGLSAANHEVF
jgi:hypothetical protein